LEEMPMRKKKPGRVRLPVGPEREYEVKFQEELPDLDAVGGCGMREMIDWIGAEAERVEESGVIRRRAVYTRRDWGIAGAFVSRERF
jgi:hypothetical protein